MPTEGISAMFALLALVCFVVVTFGGHIGSLNLIALGLALVAAHLLFSWGPVASRMPWGRPSA